MSEKKEFMKDQEMESVNGGYTTKVVLMSYTFMAGETYEDGTYRYVVTRTVSDLYEDDGVPVRMMLLNNIANNREASVQVKHLVNSCRRV